MKNIVVGIDFSESSKNALKHAVATAIRFKVPIHLVWVKTPGSSSELLKGNDIQAIAEEKLDELLVEVHREADDICVQRVILQGKPYDEICKYANNLQGALIVIGSHGMSGYEERNIGANTYRIVTLAKCPVLSIRLNTHIGRDLTHIMVPIDASFETLQKVYHVIQFAKAFNAKLILLGTYTSSDMETKHVVNIHLRQAQSMCDEAAVRYETTTVSIRGNVCKSLIEYAITADVNLLAIMRDEEEEFADLWLGSTTRRLLSNTPMPLLIVPNVNHFQVSK